MNCELYNEGNKSYYNYCLKDGIYLNSFKNPYLIKDSDNKTCSICNIKNKGYYIYCIDCGNELYQFTK